jgi:tRNA(fMet)-specific endonuclease VapC
VSYLLDTDTCINIIRSRKDSLIRKVTAMGLEKLSVSTITIAELQYGVAKSSVIEQNTVALAQFLAPMKVREFDEKAASFYGSIRANLQAQGLVIGPYDMLIAAQALSYGLTLVTNNIKEFKRIKGLSLESWHEIATE